MRRAALALALLAWGLSPSRPAVAADAAGVHDEEAGGGTRLVRLTGEFKLIDVTLRAREGDQGFAGKGDDTRDASLASLRLMAKDADGAPLLWEVHYVNTKIDQAAGASVPGATGAQLFRYEPLRWNLERPETGRAHPASAQTLIWYHEIDRASVRWQGDSWAASVGRQPISWGTGRFWQPLDVFGAFAPTELEREYKPGVDAGIVELAPAPFSSVAAVFVASPKDEPEASDSYALHGRLHVGEVTELTGLAGSVRDERVAGASIETSWLEAGWRLEALHGDPPANQGDPYVFAIAGVDRQFGDSLLVAVELYRHSAGAVRAEDLAKVAASPAVLQGFQKQLSRDVAGVTVQKDLTALLNGSYTVLASKLAGDPASLLHQATLTYSIADEADALFSVLTATGKGLDALGAPQSEFGHVPDTLYLRLRFFF